MQQVHRIGVVLSGIEGGLFLVLAMRHLSFASGMFAVGAVDAILAIALFVTIAMPKRLIGVQIMTVIGVIVAQLLVMRTATLFASRDTVWYGVALMLSVMCVALVAWPTRRHA